MDKETNSVNKIICPKCGYEFTLGEVFFPKDLLGGYDDIQRDEEGKIKFNLLKAPATFVQEWECFNCRSSIKVKATVNINTTLTEEEDDWYEFKLKEK